MKTLARDTDRQTTHRLWRHSKRQRRPKRSSRKETPAHRQERKLPPKPAEPKVRKPLRVPKKTFDVSSTVGIPNTDIRGETFNKMISRLRAEQIWRACTTPQSVEVADVDNILFGIDTPARYFEAPTIVKAESNDSEPPVEVEEVALPAEDETTPIPLVNLERTEGSGADLEQVQEAVLDAGFAVDRKTTKEMESNDVLSECIRLWM
ncbi:hypothetical protein R1sor_024839 [Riccia sorocarpa]|uniref:Uncharacterized protein n=1 Tax=Riccia sorocarpa TaxID=122646 RepID=A0ABD3GRT5_9MARC